MKKNLLFAFLLISVAGVLSSEAFGQRVILGGFKVVAKTDAGAVAAADFAIEAQSEKTEKEYTLEEIVKAERQVVQGTNYRLCMEVSADGSDTFFVQAVVYVDLKGNRKLTSWADSSCGEAAAAGRRQNAVLPECTISFRSYKFLSPTMSRNGTKSRFDV